MACNAGLIGAKVIASVASTSGAASARKIVSFSAISPSSSHGEPQRQVVDAHVVARQEVRRPARLPASSKGGWLARGSRGGSGSPHGRGGRRRRSAPPSRTRGAAGRWRDRRGTRRAPRTPRGPDWPLRRGARHAAPGSSRCPWSSVGSVTVRKKVWAEGYTRSPSSTTFGMSPGSARNRSWSPGCRARWQIREHSAASGGLVPHDGEDEGEHQQGRLGERLAPDRGAEERGEPVVPGPRPAVGQLRLHQGHELGPGGRVVARGVEVLDGLVDGPLQAGPDGLVPPDQLAGHVDREPGRHLLVELPASRVAEPLQQHPHAIRTVNGSASLTWRIRGCRGTAAGSRSARPPRARRG